MDILYAVSVMAYREQVGLSSECRHGAAIIFARDYDEAMGKANLAAHSLLPDMDGWLGHSFIVWQSTITAEDDVVLNFMLDDNGKFQLQVK